jgi:hypothetical protein
MDIGSLSRRYSKQSVALTTCTHVEPSFYKDYRYTTTRLWAFLVCSRVKFNWVV